MQADRYSYSNMKRPLLQIEAVRYKRSAERCRIISRLIPVAATPPAEPIGDSLDTFSLNPLHWFDLSRIVGGKFIAKSVTLGVRIAGNIKDESRTKSSLDEIYLPNTWELWRKLISILSRNCIVIPDTLDNYLIFFFLRFLLTRTVISAVSRVVCKWESKDSKASIKSHSVLTSNDRTSSLEY